MKNKRHIYETADSLRRMRNQEEYKIQYEKLLKEEIVLPGWRELNYLKLAKALHPAYAEDLERDRRTKYGSLLGKG